MVHIHILLDLFNFYVYSFYNSWIFTVLLFKAFGSLVYIFKFIFSILFMYPCFVT